MTSIRTFADRRGLRDGIRNADLDHNFALLNSGGSFPGNPGGSTGPVLLVVTGQSNSGGGISAATVPMVKNDNVFDWSSGGTGQTLGTTHDWIAQSPDSAQYGDYDVNEIYTGLTRGGIGHVGWAAADRIQRLTNRDVYMVCVHKSGTAIANWLTGGDVQLALSSRLAAALASPEIVAAGLTIADMMIWSQGESDGLRAVNDYVADWNTVRDWMEAEGWVEDRATQWYLTQTPSIETSVFANCNMFMEALDNTNDEFVRVIRTDRMIPHDNLHFTGDDANSVGSQVGRQVLLGPAAKQGKQRTFEQNSVNGSAVASSNVGVLTDWAGAQYPLDVRGTAAAQELRLYQTGAGPNDILIEQKDILTANLMQFNTEANNQIYQMFMDATSFVTMNAAVCSWNLDGAERVRITSAGSVGIGNANAPDYSGYTTLTIGDSDAGNIGLNEGGAIRGSLFATSGGLGLQSASGKATTFSTGSIDAMTISSAGNVGIGTDAPGGTLDVRGNFIVQQESGVTALATLRKIAGPTLAGQECGRYQMQAQDDTSTNRNIARIRAYAETDITATTRNGSLRFDVGVDSTITERMRIASNGDVGIGTTTPQSPLDVNGTIRIAGSLDNSLSFLGLAAVTVNTPFLQLTQSGSGPDSIIIEQQDVLTANLLRFNTADNNQGYEFATGATGSVVMNDAGFSVQHGADMRFKIDSNGNVGIGTDASTNVLEMEREGVVQLILNTTTPLGDSGIRFRQDGSTVGRILSRIDKSLGFYAGGSTERMRIDPAGQVGIGTTAPDATLHLQRQAVAGAVYVANDFILEANSPSMQALAIAGGTYSFYMGYPAAPYDAGIIYEGANRSLHFRAGNAERMRIASDGQVSYGTQQIKQPVTTYGNVSTAGAILGGSDFTVAKGGTGIYTLTFTKAATAVQAQAIVCTAVSIFNVAVSASPINTTQIQVQVFSTSGSYANNAFTFSRQCF